jgi:hypothetical protein
MATEGFLYKGQGLKSGDYQLLWALDHLKQKLMEKTIISLGTKPVIKKFTSHHGHGETKDQDQQDGPFHIFDQDITGFSNPIAQRGKEDSPNEATDQLQGKEFSLLHVQDAKGQGAGQAYAEDILGDEQTHHLIAADDVFGLLDLMLQFRKSKQYPGRGGFSEEIKNDMAYIRGKGGRRDYQPEIQISLKGE